MSTWKGVLWSIWLHSMGGELFAQPKFYFDVLVLLSWNISYAALYDLSYTLHNPFGHRRLDVAHETIGGGIRRLSQQLMEGESHLPPKTKAP